MGYKENGNVETHKRSNNFQHLWKHLKIQSWYAYRRFDWCSVQHSLLKYFRKPTALYSTPKELATPTNRTELRLTPGLINFFWQLVPSSAQIAAPLSLHLEKDQPASLAPLESNNFRAMETLKTTLISLPILELPYSRGDMMHDRNTWNIEIVYLLLQKQPDDTTKPIEYSYRSLTGAKKLYNISQHECFGMI